MLTLTFAPYLLELIVPDGATPESTWIVAFAHRKMTAVDGVAVLGRIDGWQPFMPFPTAEAAQTWAVDFAAATANDVEQWLWYAADDDGLGLELYAVFADGSEGSTDIAVFPLSALAEDGA